MIGLRNARAAVAPALTLIPMALALTAGCGGEPRLESVSGVVTLDGTPLDEGNIRFDQVEGKGLAVGSDVKNGRYSLPNPPGLSPGQYRVAITSRGGSASVAGTAPDFDLGKPGGLKDRIPIHYNEKSTLRAEVKAGGPNSFDFTLSGKPAPAEARTARR